MIHTIQELFGQTLRPNRRRSTREHPSYTTKNEAAQGAYIVEKAMDVPIRQKYPIDDR
jgi:hypothetical protein